MEKSNVFVSVKHIQRKLNIIIMIKNRGKSAKETVLRKE